jgi:dihydrofolate reductase/thymidylate synthase
MFNLILASDINGGIGFKNNIPWSFKKDMAFFKHMTTNPISNKIVIMGRNTLESLPFYYFPNRTNIVVTSHNISINNVHNIESFNKALGLAYDFSPNKDCNDIWVIGGAQLYEEALKHPDLKYIYHTQINGTFDCDRYITLPKCTHLNIDRIIDIDRNTNKEYELFFNKYEIPETAEVAYLRLLKDVVDNGDIRQTRNAKTYSLFDREINFDVSENFPLLTTKRMFLRGIIEELLFFIRGETDSSKLSEKGVRIWEGNTSQEFLDKMGFDYKVGEMGPMYGYQWRHFGKPYKSNNSNKNDVKERKKPHSVLLSNEDIESNGIDLFKNLIDEIKTNPHSRRLLMTDFNPAQVQEGVLYPCHSIILQFYVDNDKLSVKMYQRSADMFLGVPFNIASTTLLLYIVSKLTGYKPGRVGISFGDCHIYEDHIGQVNRQLSRTPYNQPRLVIPEFSTIEEVENAKYEDFILEDYSYHPGIKASMVA